MKACLLLQRRFAYVGHKLAKILKEKYGIEEFCGYVYLRSSFEFLKNQKDINYTSLLLDEDIHNCYRQELLDLEYLKNLEKEYGLPNLWPYIAPDRVVMFNMLAREYPYNKPKYNHEEMMRILQVKAKAIIKFLDEERPDFLFASVIGGIGSILLFHIAKSKGIKIILCAETRINDDLTLSEGYKNFSWAEELFDNLTKNNTESKKIREANDYLKKFREYSITYFYAFPNKNRGSRQNQLKWFLPNNFFRSLIWFVKSTFNYFFKKKFLDYCEESPWGFFIDRLKRKTRLLIGFQRLYEPTRPTEDYAFFPLHYEPEISLLMFAPFWTDQINLIRQIAKSLPLHFKLYVKEHPAMLGYRPYNYYRELKKIPNVKLIDPTVSPFDIIRNAKLVTAITSTIGWEAILLKKPVITFGDVSYNKLSSVKHCHDIERLPFLVKEQLEKFNYNESELINFIGAILEESSPINLAEIWGKGVTSEIEKEKLTLLADLIAKKLNLKLPVMINGK